MSTGPPWHFQPVVGPSFWRGVRSMLLVEVAFLALGLGAAWWMR